MTDELLTLEEMPGKTDRDVVLAVLGLRIRVSLDAHRPSDCQRRCVRR